MSNVFRALADPTRRRVLQLLRKGPMGAGELAAHFDVSKPTMSAHFAVLVGAGLVEAEKSGRAITYRVKRSVLEDALLGFAHACGLELANAFGELTDVAEQRRRFAADQAKKLALYGEVYPIDEDFLAALDHGMPESAGIALGFDRLVMLAAGANHIDDVLWAPVV